MNLEVLSPSCSHESEQTGTAGKKPMVVESANVVVRIKYTSHNPIALYTASKL